VAAGGAAGADAGGAGGDAGTSATLVTDVASFHRAQFEALCQFVFECPNDDEDSVSFRIMTGTQARCVDMLVGSPLYLAAEHDLEQKVHDGSIELLLDRVPACLDALRACQPEVYGRLDVRACRAVFRGSSLLGGDCSRAEDCANDARCLIDAECPGHCAPRAALDEPCNSASDCDDSGGPVVCDSGFTCKRLTVRPAVGLGDACVAPKWNAPDVTPCEAGLYCEESDGTSGICRAPVGKDGDCTEVHLCSDGQVCIFTDTGEQWLGFCRTATVTDVPGAACDPEARASCDAVGRLWCIDGTCQEVGDGTEGSLCQPVDEAAFVACDRGLVCLDPDPATDMVGPGGEYWGTCGKPRAAGEPCVENDDCASQHCRADGTCGDSYCCGTSNCASN
jgi:hypothetical protein